MNNSTILDLLTSFWGIGKKTIEPEPVTKGEPKEVNVGLVYHNGYDACVICFEAIDDKDARTVYYLEPDEKTRKQILAMPPEGTYPFTNKGKTIVEVPWLHKITVDAEDGRELWEMLIDRGGKEIKNGDPKQLKK